MAVKFLLSYCAGNLKTSSVKKQNTPKALHFKRNSFTFKPVTKNQNGLNFSHDTKKVIKPSPLHPKTEILGSFIG